MTNTLTPRVWAELLLLSLIWGASFLAIRTALDEIPFVTSVAWRVGLAAGVMWAVALALRLPLPRRARDWGALAGMGLLNNVLPFSLMAWGQLSVETGLTSILNAGTAVFGVVAAAVFLSDERLTPRRALGVTLGFLGVATAIGLHSLLAFDLRSLSQLAIVAGTICYALAGVWGRLHLGGLSPQVAATGTVTMAAAVMIPAALVIDGPSLPRLPLTWVAIAYYAIIATAFAYLLYFRILARAGSGNLLLCTLMIPPVAITLGALLRGESLGPNTYAGFALLVLGLLILDGRVLARVDPRRRQG